MLKKGQWVRTLGTSGQLKVLTFESRFVCCSHQLVLYHAPLRNRTHPSAIKMKSASPCTITARSLLSITLGSTERAGGRLLSPLGNTLILEHSVQSTSRGAWMAALTSSRLKYSGETCVCGKDPGKPSTSHKIGHYTAYASAKKVIRGWESAIPCRRCGKYRRQG